MVDNHDQDMTEETARKVFEEHSIIIPVSNRGWATGPERDPEEGFVLEHLQQAVAGFVELTSVCDAGAEALRHSIGGMVSDPNWVDDLVANLVLVVNEEGILMQLDYNPEASAIAGKPIAGQAVLLDGRMFN